MRRRLSIAVAAAAVLVASASHTAPARASGLPARLTVVTVPRLSGIHFSLDGTTFATGPDGTAQIETTRGPHLLRLLDRKRSTPGVRSTFQRWGDSKFHVARPVTIGDNTVIDAGFQQYVRVGFAFADGEGRPVVGRVKSVTLTNTQGSQKTFVPGKPQWLQASSVIRRFNGLERTPVEYSLEKALVGGSNVVNKSQQRFYPEQTRHVTASLLLYSARITVRDFVFGTASGRQVELVYPNGRRVTYPLHGRTLVFPSLPRGTYEVEVKAGGYVPKVSLALSRDQVLDVKVVSYPDMLLFFVVAFAAVAALILIPRPHLRRRIRSALSRRPRAKDDLEPKPTRLGSVER